MSITFTNTGDDLIIRFAKANEIFQAQINRFDEEIMKNTNGNIDEFINLISNYIITDMEEYCDFWVHHPINFKISLESNAKIRKPIVVENVETFVDNKVINDKIDKMFEIMIALQKENREMKCQMMKTLDENNFLKCSIIDELVSQKKSIETLNERLDIITKNSNENKLKKFIVDKMREGFNHIKSDFSDKLEKANVDLGDRVLSDFELLSSKIDKIQRNIEGISDFNQKQYEYQKNILEIKEKTYENSKSRRKGIQEEEEPQVWGLLGKTDKSKIPKTPSKNDVDLHHRLIALENSLQRISLKLGAIENKFTSNLEYENSFCQNVLSHFRNLITKNEQFSLRVENKFRKLENLMDENFITKKMEPVFDEIKKLKYVMQHVEIKVQKIKEYNDDSIVIKNIQPNLMDQLFLLERIKTKMEKQEFFNTSNSNYVDLLFLLKRILAKIDKHEFYNPYIPE